MERKGREKKKHECPPAILNAPLISGVVLTLVIKVLCSGGVTESGFIKINKKTNKAVHYIAVPEREVSQSRATRVTVVYVT